MKQRLLMLFFLVIGFLSFNINVLAASAPVISLKGSNPTYIDFGDEYEEKGFVALDETDGDLTKQVVVDKTLLDVNKIGNYEIKYSVTNSLGITTTKIRNAIVIQPVRMYIFHSATCPHCKDLLEKVETVYKKTYPNLVVYEYEVYYDRDNQKLFQEVGELLDKNVGNVPFTIIGDETVVGYSEGVTDKKITSLIENYNAKPGYCDEVGAYLKVTSKSDACDVPITEEPKKELAEDEFKIPFVGVVKASDFSLPILAVIMGTIDGFNPCAMWVLLFLITMLLGMKNKKRMWILGLAFIITSALIYLFFMLAWLKAAMFINSVFIFRMIIAVVAIIGGLINIKSAYSKKDDGCEVIEDKKRKKIFARVKNVTSEKKFYLALFGIIALAAIVNLVELLCSAGLPMVFTQVLAINDLTGTSYLGYILLYILFFMLDDIIIFAIAMLTLKVTGISTKYGKISHLIGGIVMIIIGLLLIFEPGLLSFS